MCNPLSAECSGQREQTKCHVRSVEPANNSVPCANSDRNLFLNSTARHKPTDIPQMLPSEVSLT